MSENKFSDHIYFIPFGRFRKDKERTGNSASIYVGREGHRAFLIEALNGGGRRGAYLVTGRRGVGKTTFVESCLSEYQSGVYRRFLRSSYGRSGIDLLMMTCLAFLLVFILLATTNFIEILSIAQNENSILWVPLLMLIFLGGIPLILSYRIIKTLFSNVNQSLSRVASIVTITVMIYIVWGMKPFGSPVESISKLILTLSIISIFGLTRAAYSSKPRKGYVMLLKPSLVFMFSLAIVFFNDSYFLDKVLNFTPTPGFLKDLAPEVKIIAITLIMALFLSVSALAVSGIKLIFLSKEREKNDESSGERKITKAINKSGRRYLVSLILPILLICTYHFLYDQSGIELVILFFLCFLLVASIGLYEFRYARNKHLKYTPPGEAVLMLKALILCCITLQIIYPVIGVSPGSFPISSENLTENISNKKGGSKHFRSSKSLNSCSIELEVGVSGTCEQLIGKGEAKGDNLYFTLFIPGSYEEEVWLILVSLLLMFLYLIEYEWINRPFIAQRQTRVLDPGERMHHQAHHHMDPVWYKKYYNERLKSKPKLSVDERNREQKHLYKLQRDMLNNFRSLEKITFPYILCSFWMPSIVARINLGFDSLDHRGVTHAMLHGLSEEYKKKFTGWSSIYGILISMIMFFLFLLVTESVGDKFLSFDNHSKIKNEEVSIKKEVPVDSLKIILENKGEITTDYCSLILRLGQREKLPYLFCEISLSFSNKLLPIIYYPVINISLDNYIYGEVSGEGDNHYVFKILHYNLGLPVDQVMRNNLDRSLDFRIYHLLIFLILLWFFRFISKRYSIFPYKRTIKKIEELHEALNYKRTERRSPGQWSPVNIIRKTFSVETESETSRDEIDPRSIELAFLSLLEDMQNTAVHAPFFPSMKISIPTPEIHFVFDELDKISGMVGAEKLSSEYHGSEQSLLQDERQRAFALHQLLSDMKRVISSAPARFIFVGSRMLHDEWMADQGRREPLLSSIFDAEIYLPSLMLDLPKNKSEAALKGYRSDLSYRVREYLLRTHDSATKLYENIALSRFLPFYALKENNNVEGKFYEDDFSEEYLFSNLVLSEQLPNKTLLKNDLLGSDLIDDYIKFLTYRSAGNPKKMQEVLSTFIRPAARYTNEDTSNRYARLPCRDAIVLTDKDVYRIQFISSLFSHITETFDYALTSRDDKVSVNIFYLFDFLMKFHQRAFSWSSLDRIDELSHIHRAPDIRKLFEKVVEDSSELYLHKLLHGLFTFRFKSEFSAEIKYLSRRSKPEMAAFNFTLDESQELKAIYTAILNVQGETNVEVIEALGELHEYDQAYETARGYYEQALKLYDAKFSRYMGEFVDLEDRIYDEYIKAVNQISFTNDRTKADELTRNIDELNKKVDKSTKKAAKPTKKVDKRVSKYKYEVNTFIQKNSSLDLELGDYISAPREVPHEENKQHYKNMRLASLLTNINGPNQVPLMKAILMHDAEGIKNTTYYVPWIIKRVRLMLQIGLTFELELDFERAQAQYHAAHWLTRAFTAATFSDSAADNKNWIINFFKHMSLLLQPIFAEAWVAEKMDATIDTSTGMVEYFLVDVRRRFPFLKEAMATANSSLSIFFDKNGKPQRRAAVGDSNFALIGAELHDKAGDLYFFKGKGLGDRESDPKEYVSYLFKAHYHYAVALHELRRFNFYRVHSSSGKFNITNTLDNVASDKNTINNTSRPRYVDQSISHKLFDFGESIRARQPLISVLRQQENQSYSVIKKGKVKLHYDLSAFLIEDTAKTIKDFSKIIRDWFYSSDEDLAKIFKVYGIGDHELPKEEIYKIFGRWQLKPNDLMQSTLNILGFGEFINPRFEIQSSLIFSVFGAISLSKSKAHLDAANEFCIVIDHVAKYLKWFRVYFFVIKQERLTKGALKFIQSLIRLSCYSVSLCDECYRAHKNIKTHDLDGLISNVIPVNAAAVVCDLQLSIDFLAKNIRDSRIRHPAESLSEEQANISSDRKLLEQIIFDWFPEGMRNHKNCFKTRLKLMLKKHKFPALAHIKMLKSLIDNRLIEQVKDSLPDEQSDVLEWFDELRETEKKFDSPMHFTPLMMAETAFLVCKACSLCPSNKMIHNYKNIALDQISCAEQMFSQGDQYYKSISKLYYLFDDFNDRRLHADHSIQMAGADLLILYRDELGKM